MQLKLPSRSSKWRHKYLEDPATICSTVNYRLQNISPRLASTVAINVVISTIRKRQDVHRLYLGASSLGDAGCIRLFAFLSSPAGLHCRDGLTELFLTRNEVGVHGLLAVAAFLKDNMVLRELCLSGNPLTTDQDVITEFTSALNSSRLCTLQILHSSSLGDPFAQIFLSGLSAPYLRELDLSAINMTRAIVPTLTDYIRSPRCRLERLQCNANSLTLSGARSIVCAIEENYTLVNVRLDDLHLEDHIAAAEDRTMGWQGCKRALFAVLERNSKQMMTVRKEALALLRYARALFLRSGMARAGKNQTFVSVSRHSRDSQSLFSVTSPFFDLPAELQQEIISYLAPSLSHQQRMGIVHFASDIASLVPRDPRSNEIHGPDKRQGTAVKTGIGKRGYLQQVEPQEGTWRPPIWWECHCSSKDQPYCQCRRRWKRERRDIWLTQVACHTYEHA